MDNSPQEPKRATVRVASIALAVVALVAVLIGVTTAAAQSGEPLVVASAIQTDDTTEADDTAETDESDAGVEENAGDEEEVGEDPAIEAAFEAFDACLRLPADAERLLRLLDDVMVGHHVSILIHDEAGTHAADGSRASLRLLEGLPLEEPSQKLLERHVRG